MPNSQRVAFESSSGFYSYWRRIQKSFLDYIGSGKVGEVPNDDLSSVPSLNKGLALLTPCIVFGAISSEVGFMEWHQSRGGWMSYANDFPFSWPGHEIFIGSSPGVPIRKEVIEQIGSTASPSKGKEKKGKKSGVGKNLQVKKDVRDTEAGQGTKKRKASATSKRLPVSEEYEEVAFAVVEMRSLGKEITHPSFPKVKVKTKVETSKFQTPISSRKGTSLQLSLCWKNTCLYCIQDIRSEKLMDLLHSQLITCTM